MSTDTRTRPQRARANGIELCWDSFGDPGAAPMLLIMGLAAQMIAWPDAFCERLAQRGFRVVRFDNRDIGLSTRFDAAGVPNIGAALTAAMQGKPVDAPYRLSDMAADAFGLLDALDIERAHVVGASMGGAIAQTMAIERPERLRTLTSIMATTGEPGLPPPTPEAMGVLLKPPVTTLDGYIRSYLETWKVLRAGSFPEEEALDRERAEAVFARGLNPAGVARQLAAILASGSRKAALRSVHVPTLVLHGDADPLVPLPCGVDTAQSIPGARLVVLPGMGHALPIACWPRIIDEIARHAG
ncbi:MAG: alpha/beta hydrolase [Rhizobacter sp.]|nr:alpha/beta hydrolase [Rhizobacter sp.]